MEAIYYDIDMVKEKLAVVIDIMWKRCELKKKFGKTLTLKIRFADFSTITKSHSQSQPFTEKETISCLMELLPNEEIKKSGIRLLGATMSNFLTEDEYFFKQLKIDFDASSDIR